MITFDQYFEERFSLTPRDWFTPQVKAVIDQEDIKLRSNARRKAVETIPKLKKLLRDRQYLIMKHDFAFSHKDSRMIGLSRSDSRDTTKFKDPVNNIPYMKVMFTLAHEIGHVLQWRDDGRKVNFEKFCDELFKAAQTHSKKEQEVKSLHNLWYELDAWVRGLELVPQEYKSQYKQYAYMFYKSYMDREPKYYWSDTLFRNLLYKLNYDEQ
jgi:hypothetical protein